MAVDNGVQRHRMIEAAADAGGMRRLRMLEACGRAAVGQNGAEPSRIIRSRVLSPHCADHASRGAVTAGALDPTG